MKKALFLHLLNISYPTDSTIVDKERLKNIITRFDKKLDRLELTDDGKIIGNNYFITDLRAGGKEMFESALYEFDDIDDTVKLVISDPKSRDLLVIIREFNDRGYTIDGIDTNASLQTIVTFQYDYD